MLKSVVSIAALLLATAILYAGNGLQGTLLAVRGGLEGFPTAMLGALTSAYFVGFIVGCRKVPSMIRSVGHIRTFVALASIASSSALAHALFVDVYAWAVLRAITGFAFAGLAMVLESWINDRATNANRGKVLSVYRMVDLGSLAIGNALLATASPATFHLFALVSILMSIALVPVALTRTTAPATAASVKLDISLLYRASPVAAIGSITTGLGNGAFWGMAPVFAQRLGYNDAAIAGFMTTAILGAVVSLFPMGWASDAVDRRKVIIVTVFFGITAALTLATIGGSSKQVLLLCGFTFGACVLPVYGLCAAHANDHADPGTSVTTSGGLLLLHGLGAMVGATLAAVIMSFFGAPSLFIYIGAVYGLFLVFALVRVVKSPPTDTNDKESFVPAPRSPATQVYETEAESASNDNEV